MKIGEVHHLNCGSMCPVGARFANKERRLVCHCLLVEVGDRLMLVDSGLGTADYEDPNRRLGPMRHVMGITGDYAETALSQVQALGYDPSDVTHILVTHLDLDHAGGISDFPHAKIHLMEQEHGAAMAPNRKEKSRYRPPQWQHGPDWATYVAKGEPWNGFEAVRELQGLPPEVLLVPLFGHSRGHAAIAVQTSERWLLHAGDAYFHENEMHPTKPSCPVGLEFFQRAAAMDNRSRKKNRDRLRDLANTRADVSVFSAHDPNEFSSFGNSG